MERGSDLDPVWVLTDGRQGHVAQTLGLAERLSPHPIVKTLGLRAPFRQASPFLGLAGPAALTARSSPIEPPWPRLVVTSGRQSLAIALWLKRRLGDAVRIVNVQDPGYFRGRFDLIVVPEHDRLSGPNILSTLGALGRVTPDLLGEAARRFGPVLDHLPRPRVAVLIGGPNAVYRMPPGIGLALAERLAALAAAGAGLMITFSRRTEAATEACIRDRLAGAGAVIWDGTGDNPYFGYLALADHLLVTEDSASMVSEAATTGKPIGIIRLEGGSEKFARFHAAMRARGVTTDFDGALPASRYAPLDETGRAAQRVRRLFAP